MYFIKVDNRIGIDERGHVIDIAHFQKPFSPPRLRERVEDDAKFAFQAQNLSDSYARSTQRAQLSRRQSSPDFSSIQPCAGGFLGRDEEASRRR